MPRPALIRFLHLQPEPLHQIACLRRCGAGLRSSLQVLAVNNKIKCILFCYRSSIYIYACPKQLTRLPVLGARPSGVWTRLILSSCIILLYGFNESLLSVLPSCAFSSWVRFCRLSADSLQAVSLSLTTKSNHISVCLLF